MPTSRAGYVGTAVSTSRPRKSAAASADTTSAGIRRVIASATAVFPEAVGPESARTSGRDGGTLAAGQRGRRRAFDQHLDEVARLAAAGEVDGRVPTRTTPQQCPISA